MLNQSILLNLQIGWKNFQIVFGLGLGVFALSFLPNFFTGLILQIPFLLIATYFIYKGLYDMFYRSVFGDGSLTYMTLPFSEKDMVRGKLIAATIYLCGYNLLFLGLIIVSTLTKSGPLAFLGLIFSDVFSPELLKISHHDMMFLIAIAAVLPLFALADAAVSNAVLLCLMIQLNLNGNSWGSFWAFMISIFLGCGINQLVLPLMQELLPKGIWPAFLVEVAFILLAAVLAAILTRVSENSLKYRYNG